VSCVLLVFFVIGCYLLHDGRVVFDVFVLGDTESEDRASATATALDAGAVRNVVGIIIGVISEKLIIAYYAASSIG
jgi:hypothetical protein